MLSNEDLELFRAKNFAHVSTLRRDGSPHAAVVWADEADGTVRFNSSQSSVKVRNLQHDPRVSVSVHDQENPYKAVVVTGTARLTTDGAEEHIDRLTQKYTGQERYPQEWRSPGEVRVKIEITPEAVSRYGY